MSRKRGLCGMSRDGRLCDILMYSWYVARAAQSKFLMLRSHPFTETLDKENISESYEKLSGGRKWGRREPSIFNPKSIVEKICPLKRRMPSFDFSP